MVTQTSTIDDSLEYGFSIDPTTKCRAVNVRLHEILHLYPGNQYYMPWDENDVIIIPTEDIVTTDSTIDTGDIQLQKDNFLFNWENGLSELGRNIDAVELQHKALSWR